MYQAGLVLEGGGMKGMYTCGVLEFFLEKGNVVEVTGIDEGQRLNDSLIPIVKEKVK